MHATSNYHYFLHKRDVFLNAISRLQPGAFLEVDSFQRLLHVCGRVLGGGLHSDLPAAASEHVCGTAGAGVTAAGGVSRRAAVLEKLHQQVNRRNEVREKNIEFIITSLIQFCQQNIEF